jgi:hypothetical protein
MYDILLTMNIREIRTRIQQIPRYPDRGISKIIRGSVLRWEDPNPEVLRPDATRIFITGHMVDKPTRVKPRFPDTAGAITTVTNAMHGELDKLYEAANQKGEPLDLVLCSGSNGADLIAVRWALAKNKTQREGQHQIHIRAFLPYNKDTFISRSVAVDGSQSATEWLDTFTELIAQDRDSIVEPQFRGYLRRRRNPEVTKEVIDTEFDRRYGKHNARYSPYEELTQHIVKSLRKGDKVLALWDGEEPDGPGGTIDSLVHAYKAVGRKPENITVIKLENTGEGQVSATPFGGEEVMSKVLEVYSRVQHSTRRRRNI